MINRCSAMSSWFKPPTSSGALEGFFWQPGREQLLMVATTRLLAGVDPRDGVAAEVGHPDGARGGGDRLRPGADLDGRDRPMDNDRAAPAA
jgi:hypothetical protein